MLRAVHHRGFIFLVIKRPIGMIEALLGMLGRPDAFPEALRTPALFALPVVVPLVTMLYWVWRVRFRRSFRGIGDVTAPKALGMTRSVVQGLRSE